MPWQPPSLTLRWGSYVKPDEQSQLYMVQAVQGALGGSGGVAVITKRIALEKLKQAGVFEIENVSAVLESLDEEAQEKLAQQQELMQQQASLNPPPKPGAPPAKPPQRPPAAKP